MKSFCLVTALAVLAGCGSVASGEISAAGASGVDMPSGAAGAPNAGDAGAMAGAPATPQIDASNCDTALEPTTTDCDAAHSLVIRCGAKSGVGEANPDGALCVSGSGVPGMTWCCEPSFAAPTCEATAAANGKRLWRFENAADEPGVPSSCANVGSNSYECDASACLLVPYAGTCPACQ